VRGGRGGEREGRDEGEGRRGGKASRTVLRGVGCGQQNMGGGRGTTRQGASLPVVCAVRDSLSALSNGASAAAAVRIGWLSLNSSHAAILASCRAHTVGAFVLCGHTAQAQLACRRQAASKHVSNGHNNACACVCVCRLPTACLMLTLCLLMVRCLCGTLTCASSRSCR